MRAVVALGGNSLLEKGSEGTIDEQKKEIRETSRHIAALIEDGHEIVLTHGNGPQVGNLMLQQSRSPGPDMPLDVLVAETQAQIGYLLQQGLDNELESEEDFITVVTQVVVDREDDAFDDPTKPVGPFYTGEEAEEKPFTTRKVGDGDKSHRRVVPSPEPVDIVESEEIGDIVDRGSHVICCGGGGIPVVEEDGFEGVEAVVDKDRSSQLLANELGAEELVILTDVEHAYTDYGEERQEPLGRVTAEEALEHLQNGEFGEGSMAPKMEACIRFIQEGGERAVITTPEKLESALVGETGTRVVDVENRRFSGLDEQGSSRSSGTHSASRENTEVFSS